MYDKVLLQVDDQNLSFGSGVGTFALLPSKKAIEVIGINLDKIREAFLKRFPQEGFSNSGSRAAIFNYLFLLF